MASNFVKMLREGVLQVDNSEWSTWGSCHTMGLYYGGLRRVSASKRSPLAFGGAVHVGLDTFFNDYKRPGVEIVPLGKKAIAAALADAAVTGLDNMNDPKRNTDKLQDLLSSYFLEYDLTPGLHLKIVEVDGKRMVEQSFCVPLGTVDIVTRNFGHVKIIIMWIGKIDIIAHYLNALLIVDHKTTTVMGERFTDDKERSSQMLGYTYAGRYLSHEVFNDTPVFGVGINALAMRSTGFEFKFFPMPIADWKVAEWQQETLRSVEQVILQLDSFVSDGISVPTREHCVTKYGKCQYFDMCNMHPSARDRMLFDDNYFFISEWSPLD